MSVESVALEFFEGKSQARLREHHLDLTEKIMQRMRAPADGESAGAGGLIPWWVRDVLCASLVGVLLGFLFFSFLSAETPSFPQATPAPAVMAFEQVQEVETVPILEVQPLVVETRRVAPETIAGATAAGPDQRPAFRINSSRQYRRLLAGGWKLVGKQMYREAAVAFGRAVHLRPQAMGGYYGLALSLFEQGHEPEALSVIERITGKKGGRAELWLLLGTAYQFLGEEKSARGAYQKYLLLSPRGSYARDVKSLLSREKLPRLRME